MRPFVGLYSIVFAGCVRQSSLSSVDPGLAYCVLSNCLCTLCVFSIVSKSLGCDNSEFYELCVSWIGVVVYRSVAKTVGVFYHSALIHLDLDLVFFTLTLLLFVVVISWSSWPLR